MRFHKQTQSADKTIVRHKQMFYGLVLAVLCLVLWPKSEQFFVLHTDDHLVLSTFLSAEQLAEKGLNSAIDKSFVQQLNGAFHFFNNNDGSIAALRDYGALPWWAAEDIRWHMYRPISAITHWIDVNGLKADLTAVQIHSMIWMLVLALSSMVFYRELCRSLNLTAVFAIVLFVFNLALINNIYTLSSRNAFLVPIFTLWALIFHHRWREKDSIICMLLSCLMMLLGLLTAEAGIATAAYLGAYAFALDKRGWFKGLLATIPAAVVVVLWRLCYQYFEFGTVNIDTYLDPINSTSDFLANLSLNAPLMFFATLFSINIPPGLDSTLLGQMRIVAVVILCLAVIAALVSLKKNKLLAFALIGCFFAIVPSGVLVLVHQRTQVMISIGLFFALAILLSCLWRVDGHSVKRFTSKAVVVLVLIYHVVFPISLNAYMSFNLPLPGYPPRGYTALDDVNSPGVNSSVVYVSFPSSLFALLQPYYWNFEGESLPQHALQLAPGINSYTMRRTEKRTFHLGSDSAFVVNKEVDLLSDERTESMVERIASRNHLRDITSSKRVYKVGEIIPSKAMQVKILKVNDGVPVEVEVTFSQQVNPESMVWYQWDWQKQKMQPFALPGVGQTAIVAK